MRARSLLAATFSLLGIVGCDDPEVEEKIVSVLEHGISQAQLKCSVYEDQQFTAASIRKWFTYSADKLIDGSCLVELCTFGGSPYQGDRICEQHLLPRSSADAEVCKGYIQYDLTTSGAAFRPFIDGFYAEVDSGILSIYLRDAYFLQGTNLCIGPGPGTCSDPEPWLDYDITDSACTGRNLEAFGVTP